MRSDPEAEQRAAFVAEAQRTARLANSAAAAAAVRLVEVRRTSDIRNTRRKVRCDTASKSGRAQT